MTSQPDMQGLDPKALAAARKRIERMMHAKGLYGHKVTISSPPHRNTNSPITATTLAAEIISAYLASLPQQTAEPVAVNWPEWATDKHIAEGIIAEADTIVSLIIHGHEEEIAEHAGAIKSYAGTLLTRESHRSKFIHPASPPVGGAVKALEWSNNGWTWDAKTPFGFYQIDGESASDSPRFRLEWQGLFVADSDDLEAMKAAAQSDYETRILSALTSAERSGREAVDLAEIERVARKVNPGRSEDHIKSVALDCLSIIRNLAGTNTK